MGKIEIGLKLLGSVFTSPLWTGDPFHFPAFRNIAGSQTTIKYQNIRYQPRTPQGTMRYRQSPGPTKNKRTIN